MSTATFNHAITGTISQSSKPAFISKFIQWCEGQEENRFFWLGTAIGTHGCILTPFTVLLVAMTGVNLYLLFFAVLAMTMVLITNLAALPTKITIPTFALSVFADIVIIIAALAI